MGASRSIKPGDKYEYVKKNVVYRMHEKGNIKDIFLKDDLILQLGETELERKGMSKHHYVANKMRQLVRLVREARRKTGGSYSLFSLLSGQNFDSVIRATKSLCGSSCKEKTMNGVEMTEKPSLGLHLGHSLVKCCMINKGRGIRLRDKSMYRFFNFINLNGQILYHHRPFRCSKKESTSRLT